MSKSEVLRSQRATQAREVMQMLDSGVYRSASGIDVDVEHLVRSAVERTVDYRPEETIGLESAGPRRIATRVRVTDTTTLDCASAMARSGARPFVLNFASAKNPGGGFLGGAQAQEESLARCSALYACIHRSAMYAHHRALSDCLYTSWMIYSPDVPVIRDDLTGDLLEAPWLASFLTAPAPNARVVLDRDRSRGDAVEHAMAERIDRALSIAVKHGHRHLVLGAWGCGVFGNDPEMVARLFEQALTSAFVGVFEEVAFAVFDRSHERACLGAFEKRFRYS